MKRENAIALAKKNFVSWVGMDIPDEAKSAANVGAFKETARMNMPIVEWFINCLYLAGFEIVPKKEKDG
jgi:hypothetical protein